jgi:hypothetical protein
VGHEAVTPVGLQGGVDALQDFHEICAGAATGIEDVNPGVAQAVGDVQFLTEHGVHPGDHVLHDFRRGIPDPQVFPQLGVKGLQEGLIEILNRVAFLELSEKVGPAHPVQASLSPVKDFHQTQGF